MKIQDIKIYTSERKLKIYFDNNQEITYVKFGKDLFCGGMHSELVNKYDKVLQEIKKKALSLEYFTSNQVVIRLSDLTSAKNEMKQYINKEVNPL